MTVRRRNWLAAGIVLVLAAALWASGVVGLAAHQLAMRGTAGGTPTLNLASYRVGIEGLPIPGLDDNTSGLTFSPATGTLFTAINRPAELAELSPDGQLLRRIPLTGASDVEGITHVEGDRFRNIWSQRAREAGLEPEAVFKELFDRTALGRTVSAEDIANTQIFLASPYAASITGQAISVCGGVEMMR